MLVRCIVSTICTFNITKSLNMVYPLTAKLVPKKLFCQNGDRRADPLARPMPVRRAVQPLAVELTVGLREARREPRSESIVLVAVDLPSKLDSATGRICRRCVLPQ